MAQKIYTKTGDKGETSLLGGKRVAKTHLRIEAYGTVDELNATLGMARARLGVLASRSNLQPFCEQMSDWIQFLQNQLFVIGSHLACNDERSRKMLPPLSEDPIHQMESMIDDCQAKLPELKNFILPGGSEISSFLHFSRTVCRRAERAVLNLKKEEIPDHVVTFLNRLSDLLFVLARFANYQLGTEDLPWKK